MNIPAEFTIATAEQSQNLDARTTAEFGIESFTLMEVAGSLAAKEILETIHPGSKGVFLCGKGNNGGDALVAARYLAQHGIQISVIFVGGVDDFSTDAEKNYRLLQTIADNDSEIQISFCQAWDDFDQTAEPGFIVDGMLGTGLDNDLRGDYVDAVEWANQKSCAVFAMDIPTGLHTDSGKIMGNALSASKTFAFGTLKRGFYIGSGPEYTGEICFCELPFPNYLKKGFSTWLIDNKWLRPRRRKPARHKYEAGVIHIIAGSEGLTGAAIMAAKSAWAVGIGAVILVCPRGILPVFENNLPQIIKKPVGSHEDAFFKSNHLQEVQHIIHQKEGPTLIGPGLGREETTAAFAVELLAKSDGEIVIDADGLWALSQQPDWEKPAGASWTLTPHPGELSRLFGASLDDDSLRLKEVKKQTSERNITLLSKGFPVLIGTPDERVYVTDYDTRIFSRTGFGDILAGKITSFLALGNAPEESCIHALLDGRQKAHDRSEIHAHPLEPMDLL
jgi:NAD(P)H-hydrate epimerase